MTWDVWNQRDDGTSDTKGGDAHDTRRRHNTVVKTSASDCTSESGREAPVTTEWHLKRIDSEPVAYRLIFPLLQK